jgi:hypothetical protein
MKTLKNSISRALLQPVCNVHMIFVASSVKTKV